jgi:SAM-dependent methyltransferase
VAERPVPGFDLFRFFVSGMRRHGQLPPADSTAFYDASAGTYDRLMATPRGRRTRRAFQALVRSSCAPPGPILDFGCGTGLDARLYACTGYRVLAYDPSTAMLERLRRRCPGAIRAGRVVVVSGDLESCIDAARDMAPFACIASNFAALNQVDDAETLLERLAPLLAPRGRVILSVINPWYWRDIGEAWWWRSRARWIRGRPFVVQVGANRTIRHEPARLGRRAGLRRVAVRGAARSGRRGGLPGWLSDPLTFVVLERR